jgi:hypothetical protein
MAIANVHLALEIPNGVLEEALNGTNYEGTKLGQEPDHDREQIGERLDKYVSDSFEFLLTYLIDDPEVEVDW